MSNLGICSKIADHYYNHTEYKEGSRSDMVISEIEKLCKKGKQVVTIKDLTSAVKKAYPYEKGIEKRIMPVVNWGKRENLITKDGDSIIIDPP